MSLVKILSSGFYNTTLEHKVKIAIMAVDIGLFTPNMSK